MNMLRMLFVTVGFVAASATLPAQIDAYHEVDSATHQQKTVTLGNAGYRPISIAAYRVSRGPSSEWFSVVSGVARSSSLSVEVLALGGPWPRGLELVDDLMAGLRFRDSTDSEQSEPRQP